MDGSLCPRGSGFHYKYTVSRFRGETRGAAFVVEHAIVTAR